MFQIVSTTFLACLRIYKKKNNTKIEQNFSLTSAAITFRNRIVLVVFLACQAKQYIYYKYLEII